MSSDFATTGKVLASLATAALAYAIWKVAKILVAPYRSSVRNLPGPPSASWILGSVRDMDESNNNLVFEVWRKQYGQTFKYQEWLNLRDYWNDQIAKSDTAVEATLDVIGLAGFNYPFNALDPDGKPNELNQAFTSMFQMLVGSSSINWLLMLKYAIPVLRIFPDSFGRETAAAQAVAQRVGMKLIQEKKAEVLRAARDLLTTDIPEDRRLSDDDVLAREFFIAGHETTSFGTAWCLWALARAQDVQQKLRDELLDTLRVHAPVRATGRTATKDDILPLSEPVIDQNGRVHEYIEIDEGTDITISILGINMSKALWGDDAAEFKPERWEKPPEAIQGIPGVWGNMLTFFGGPHACIGYRFALAEMKALLFVLVRAFVFELALPVEDIIKKNAIVQRPYVRDKVDQGSQLPLVVKPYYQRM
ncbi:cytochrome P450 [Fomitopsis serialis]|uniref:cytochrome P450 n=1 Tax=Fomitopsis serialis TaxID=139415 RepID=UPI00200741F2|nr:cytochrome P450 [Neoantrodia serialis]KAH9926684.1 cytochrome P450 [Neoantrodia serialis]